MSESRPKTEVSRISQGSRVLQSGPCRSLIRRGSGSGIPVPQLRPCIETSGQCQRND